MRRQVLTLIQFDTVSVDFLSYLRKGIKIYAEKGNIFPESYP